MQREPQRPCCVGAVQDTIRMSLRCAFSGSTHTHRGTHILLDGNRRAERRRSPARERPSLFQLKHPAPNYFRSLHYFNISTRDNLLLLSMLYLLLLLCTHDNTVPALWLLPRLSPASLGWKIVECPEERWESWKDVRRGMHEIKLARQTSFRVRWHLGCNTLLY